MEQGKKLSVVASRRLSCTIAGVVLTALAGSLLPAPSPAKHMLFGGGDRKAAVVRPIIRDKWAILVGVNNHLDRSIPASPHALKNVEALSNVFKDPVCGQFGFGHVLSITSEAATTDGITRALNDWLARKALPDDMIVIYLTGLTASTKTGDPLFLTYDSDSNNVEPSSLNLHSIIGGFRSRTQSRNIVVIIDSSQAPKWSQLVPDLSRLSSDGVTVLTAAVGPQLSLTNGVLGQSLFNHHLVESIRINNGSMTLDEVCNYVRGTVLADAQQAFHQIQTPALTVPDINPGARMLAFGTPPRMAAPKPSFDMGHPIERLALERPELIPPRMGGKAMVITSRKQSAVAPIPPELLPPQNAAPRVTPVVGRPPQASSSNDVYSAAQQRAAQLVGNPPAGNGRVLAAAPAGADGVRQPARKTGSGDDSLDFGVYMDNMKREIRNAWRRPSGMENRRITAVFTIAPDGRIVNPQIVQSSGMVDADRTALDALETASPLDPPPGGYGNIDVKYVFDHTVTD